MENGENIRYEMESPNDLGYLHLSETSTDIPMISEWYPKNPISSAHPKSVMEISPEK